MLSNFTNFYSVMRNIDGDAWLQSNGYFHYRRVQIYRLIPTYAACPYTKLDADNNNIVIKPASPQFDEILVVTSVVRTVQLWPHRVKVAIMNRKPFGAWHRVIDMVIPIWM